MSRRAAAAAVLSALALAVAGCGSTGGGPGHGTVSVLYAASLTNLMEKDLGPAFARATGYHFEGFGGGSTEVAAQIKGGIRRGDVFISASPEADGLLEGSANGNHVTWYATFAKTQLVLGYEPSSRFAAQFRSKPWYSVLTEPGIRVGRTDPRLDPKGKLTVAALHEAATALKLPQLEKALSRFEVFPEQALVGRLEAGQLDAGLFYAVEASAQHIPTVALTPAGGSASYSVTVLGHAPERAGAEAFVAFLLGSRGRAILAAHGLNPTAPRLSGTPTVLSPGLRSVLPSH